MSARDQEVCDACATAGQTSCTHVDATDAAVDRANRYAPGPEHVADRLAVAIESVRTEPDPDQREQQGGRS